MMPSSIKIDEDLKQSPDENGVKVYRVSITRHKLKKGDFRADKLEVLREVPPDAKKGEHFYDPAVTLLDRICREKGGNQY